ncbi:hypothetical protein CONPUDRAFT_157068 [Coniophora puteana RWD-64-598 SS2]|uniref:Uncharacterized protein n=1 Tax=Coniophora puteana (strain RWD-64-598) TaxID=741705 RepID=A0A5M3MF42_CONPW|nr:uncharacterized protein CONPUDRAFT_157068 [Coniophora puteana RWD-64-598 SS2]EIW77889.1 hypothetical protein CONPUDRAFT_157068 [Coniophora puteana RWD-64-598 SS2]
MEPRPPSESNEERRNPEVPMSDRLTDGSKTIDIPSAFRTGGLPLKFELREVMKQETSNEDIMFEIKYVPITSKEVKRYARRVKVIDTSSARTSATKFIPIKKYTQSYKDAGTKHERYMRDGWFKCIHPEGARALTDADLLKPDNLKVATASVKGLRKKVKDEGKTLPEDTEIVLELGKPESGWILTEEEVRDDSEEDEGEDDDPDIYSLQQYDDVDSEMEHEEPAKIPKLDRRGSSKRRMAYAIKDAISVQCGYYFVSHTNRSIFWIEDFKAPIVGRVKGVKKISHIGRRIESFYWRHCGLFPNYRPVTEAVFDEFTELVYYGITDGVTSPESLVPFDADELIPVSGMFQHKDRIVGETREHTVWIIARFMHDFAHARFRDFYGQQGARLNAKQSVYYDQTQRTLFLKIFAPITFNAPMTYMNAFKRVSVDHLINRVPLKKFIDKLNDELKGYTLYSTVVLNANIVFLALIYVSPPATDSNMHPQTVAQILSYVSTVASMGSVVLGLILFRQHPPKSIDDAALLFQ